MARVVEIRVAVEWTDDERLGSDGVVWVVGGGVEVVVVVGRVDIISSSM